MPADTPATTPVLSTLGSRTNLCDHVAVLRTINQTVVEVFAGAGMPNLRQPGKAQFTLTVAASLATFFCIGVPKLLKMEYRDKKVLLAVGVSLYYLFKGLLGLIERQHGDEILVLRPAAPAPTTSPETLVISSQLSKRTGEYTLRVGKAVLLRRSIGHYFDTEGFLAEKNAREDFLKVAEAVSSGRGEEVGSEGSGVSKDASASFTPPARGKATAKR